MMDSLFVNDVVVIPLADVKLIRKRINDKCEVMDITVCLGDGLEVVLKRDEALKFIDDYYTWWEDTR